MVKKKKKNKKLKKEIKGQLGKKKETAGSSKSQKELNSTELKTLFSNTTVKFSTKKAKVTLWLMSDGKARVHAVMAEGEQVCTPCGGCRQKLKEFALPGTQVLCYSPGELRATFSLEGLLPHAFGPEYLS